MRRIHGALAMVLMLVGCADGPPLPTCASLGCPNWPSANSDPDKWERCVGDQCFCIEYVTPVGPARETTACSFEPCASKGPLCPSGEHDEYAGYVVYVVYDSTGQPVLQEACHCSPD